MSGFSGFITILLVFSAFHLMLCSQNPPVKVCQLRESFISDTGKYDARQKYLFLKQWLENCTIIAGNLVLSDLMPLPNGSDPDYSFLESIRVITGYLQISKSFVKSLSLKNLHVIKGETLVRGDALLIQRNNDYIQYENMTVIGRSLTRLDLSGLRAILRGNVYLIGNSGLCYLKDNILWEDLFTRHSSQKMRIIYEDGTSEMPETDSCNPLRHEEALKFNYPRNITMKCHKNCPILKNNRSYCWGYEESLCQISTRCRERVCDRCFTSKSGNEECCNNLCAGGCGDVSAKSCLVCLKFQDNDECVNSCPDRYTYDSTATIQKPNPNFKYKMGPVCMKKCPYPYFTSEDYCTRSCAENYWSNEINKTCIPCKDHVCPQTCNMETISKLPYLTKSALLKLKNCTSLEGSLVIEPRSFKGDDRITSIDELYMLKSIRYVSQTIQIRNNDVKPLPFEINNLTFLSNLEEVKSLKRLTATGFLVMNTGIKFLGLRNLKAVRSPLYVHNEPNLCYTDSINSDKIPLKLGGKVKSPEDCTLEGKKCHEFCNPTFGCWGPGPTFCRQCVNYKAGIECVPNCTSISGYYSPKDNSAVCPSCHTTCLRTCSGPLDTQCIGGCKYAKEKNRCVMECSHDHYFNATSRECLPCHKDCYPQPYSKTRVCSGPLGRPGDGGCNACRQIFLDEKFQVGNCSNESFCPDGYFMTTYQNQRLRPYKPADLDFISYCRPCHPMCNTCDNHGSKHPSCTSCKGVWYQDECLLTCPLYKSYGVANMRPISFHSKSTEKEDSIDMFTSILPEHESTCLLCHDECRKGCTGGNNTDCKFCKNMKIYLDADKTKFICNHTCPSDRPETENELGTNDRVCLHPSELASLRAKKIRDKIIIIIIIAIIIVLSIVFITVAWCLRKKAESDKIKELLKAQYSNITEPDSKNEELFSRQPNLGRLVMINVDDLEYDANAPPLGSGAFGAVYMGLWAIPRNISDSNRRHKLEVAIKVIEGESSASKASTDELLEEAKVMASVSHRHCLRLIGVCLSQQKRCLVSAYMPLGSMDKYLKQNVMKLNSFQLLSWAEQIADGMTYLEARGIIHRDLATRNVLLNTPDLVQITDFGLAKILNDTNTTEVIVRSGRVPIRWLAIETLTRGVYSHKTDVWSFGVTLWEIFTFGKRPYEDVDTMDIKDHVMKGGRLSQPDICTLDVYMIMVKCWMEDPESRPTFPELMKNFQEFCTVPGRYLFIQGDYYEFRGSQGNMLEMEPLNRNQNYYCQGNTNAARFSDLSGPDKTDGMLCPEQAYQQEPGTPQAWPRNNLPPIASLSLHRQKMNSTSSGASHSPFSPRRQDSQMSQPSHETYPLIHQPNNFKPSPLYRPSTSSVSPGCMTESPRVNNHHSMNRQNRPADSVRYFTDPTEDWNEQSRYLLPPPPPPPGSIQRGSESTDYINTPSPGAEAPWSEQFGAGTPLPETQDGYLEPSFFSSPNSSTGNNNYYNKQNHLHPTGSFMKNANGSNIALADDYIAPTDGIDNLPPPPPPPPNIHLLKGKGPIDNPEYFLSDQNDDADYLQPNIPFSQPVTNSRA